VTDIQSPSLGHAGWRRGSLGTFVVIPKTKQKQFLTLKEPGVTVAGSHLKQWNRDTFLVISKTKQKTISAVNNVLGRSWAFRGLEM
jgi:hypothetical protein